MLAALLLFTAAASSTTVCDRYQQADLVFTGSAETPWITTVDTRKVPFHKRSEKSKKTRFLVREWFKGKRTNTVEVWFTPADCDLTVAANQTYLVYGRMNKDNGRIESNGCIGTVAVENAAPDLRYLTAAQAGPNLSAHLSGNAGGPDVNVVAQSGINKRYAVSDAGGQYVLDGLAAGEWQVSIVGGQAQTVTLAAGSCVIADLK
jgi:hypothetical protein